MNYTEILLGSWKILLRNPYLWLFGALALLGSGAGSWVTSMPAAPPGFGGDPDFAVEVQKAVETGVAWIAGHLLVFAIIAVTLTVVTTVFWFVSVYCGAAMVWSAGQLVDGKGERSDRQAAITAARRLYWRFAGLTVILDCAVILGIGLAVTPLVLAMSSASTAVEFHSAQLAQQIGEFSAFMLVGSARDPAVIAAGFFFSVASFLIFTGVGLLREFSSRALLLDGSGVFASFRTGLGIARATPGRVLLAWIVGVAFVFALTSVVALLAVFIGGPIILLLVFSVLGEFPPALVISGVAVAALVIVTLVLLAGGMISAFFAAYWGYAYRRLTPYLVSLKTVTTTPEEPAT